MRNEHRSIAQSMLSSFTSVEVLEMIQALQQGLEMRGDYALSLLNPLKEALIEVSPLLYNHGFQATLIDEEGNHITLPSNIEFQVSEVKAEEKMNEKEPFDN